MTKDLSASIRTRLLAIAKSQNTDFNQILIRFALERILYRLSFSPYANRFVLKGALLFNLWYNMPHRATRDIDFLGFGSSDLKVIEDTFRDIANIACHDGITFDPETITVEEIRKEAGYAGARVLIYAEINKARCKTQIDIGFGDAVVPGPVQLNYPVMLSDLPVPQLQTYPIYSVISEKLHAMVLFGMANSRLKDYLDLWILLRNEIIDDKILAEAVASTFARREMLIPIELPSGLTEEFAMDSSKQSMWLAFLRKNKLDVTSLIEVVAYLGKRLKPIFLLAKNFEEEVIK